MSEEELEAIIGPQALLKLSEALGGNAGGKFIAVPETPTCENILFTILDETAYKALTEHAGKEWIYIPSGPAKRERHRRVLELSHSHSVREIADICGLSERTVRHIARTTARRRQTE